MILSCDPPRHAFLIHFAKRQQPHPIQTFRFDYRGAQAEIAVDPRPVPPSLVAIHFVRHGFRLPFILPGAEFSVKSFHLEFGRRDNQCFFHFSYEPETASSGDPIAA